MKPTTSKFIQLIIEITRTIPLRCEFVLLLYRILSVALAHQYLLNKVKLFLRTYILSHHWLNLWLVIICINDGMLPIGSLGSEISKYWIKMQWFHSKDGIYCDICNLIGRRWFSNDFRPHSVPLPFTIYLILSTAQQQSWLWQIGCIELSVVYTAQLKLTRTKDKIIWDNKLRKLLQHSSTGHMLLYNKDIYIYIYNFICIGSDYILIAYDMNNFPRRNEDFILLQNVIHLSHFGAFLPERLTGRLKVSSITDIEKQFLPRLL